MAIFGNDPDAIGRLIGLLQKLPPGASPDAAIAQVLAEQRSDQRTNTISRLSGGDAERREALSRLSPKELADLADFRARFDRLASSEQQLVLEDFANPRTVTPDAILAGKAISAIFGEEALTEAYFDGVKLRSYGLGAAQTISETATPALRFLGDLALIGNEYNPDTGRRNPGYDTPEMQAELAAARQRINRTAADAAKNTGATASAIAQTLSDLRGPDWINPETGLEYYTPSQQQRDEYFARTKRGVDSVQAATGAIVGSVVDPLAKAYDACVKGASARECGQATPGAAASATGVAGVARSAVVGVARSAAVRSLVGGGVEGVTASADAAIARAAQDAAEAAAARAAAPTASPTPPSLSGVGTATFGEASVAPNNVVASLNGGRAVAVVGERPVAPQPGNLASTAAEREPTRFFDSVIVVDRKVGTTLQGTVDLGPTLDRIKSGVSFPHRNDGSIFQNRPPSGASTPLLPVRPKGFYKEYVVPTPGVKGPGPQRIVVGNDGKMYYTPDHYDSFIPVN